MKYFLLAFKNYATFNGRSNRSEFWYFTLFSIICIVLALVLDRLMADVFQNVPVIYFVFILATLVPNLAVTVRRLHDQDKSGWWIFTGVIPFIGSIWLLILLAMEGTKGPNKYGPDPNGDVTFDFESQAA